MLAGKAFRHQMVLPEQQTIYDYWRSKCQNGSLPSRYDIDPADIRAHLPMVSLIEVNRDLPTPRFQCRLAGTGFWDLYEDEIQGRFIDDLPIGDRVDYWNRILTQVASRSRPTAGVTRPGTPFGSHLAQFWIRLPLSENGKDVNLILGYDHLIKMSDIPQEIPEREKVSA